MDKDKTERIQLINDRFRQTGLGGDILITPGIQGFGVAGMHTIVGEVMRFDRFDHDNDPHGEHDFGAFDHDGQRIFWKIDYYDLALQGHSPDAADPAVTHRVLTIMLASEY